MTKAGPTIAMLTAGAGNMICGSCLHDNAIAAALIAAGRDLVLIPTYTPIRTDENDVSIDQVFFGGINVFLQQKFGLFRRLPRFLDRWIDHPRLLRWIVAQAAATDASRLGPLTISMLKGDGGHQGKEIRRLCDWLTIEIRPHLIHLSNLLIAGCVPAIKSRLDIPVVVTLQGDDLFLEELPASYRQQAIAIMRVIASDVDAFIVHSHYYKDFITDYLGLSPDDVHVLPLGITIDEELMAPHAGLPDGSSPRELSPVTIGYLARLAPEKGLDLLVDAFLELSADPALTGTRLRIAGWHGPRQHQYVEQCLGRLRRSADGKFEFHGEIDRETKRAMLRGIDLLCVPSPYRDPKGLYALEAMAEGTPVVLPAHGAFPELVAATKGGLTFTPGNLDSLVDTLRRLIMNPRERSSLASHGQRAVRDVYSTHQTAEQVWELYEKCLHRTNR